MAKLTWNTPGTKKFENGLDRGVLYVKNSPGVAWLGLISVNESPSGGDSEAFYNDGVKHQNRPNPEEFAATIEAFTYPPEFAACDGYLAVATGLSASQQRRKPFGLSYRTRIGNDIQGQEAGYKLHLVYNALAAPTDRSNRSAQADSELMNFSWNITTTPISILGFAPTAHLVIDSTTTRPEVLTAIEAYLYGTGSSDPVLPDPDMLVELFAVAEPPAPFVVTYIGNDTYSISGPDNQASMIDERHFQLNSSFVTDHEDGTYTATSGTEDPQPLTFTITPMGNGVVQISGPDLAVKMLDANHYQLNTPFVTDNGNGSYTATSG